LYILIRSVVALVGALVGYVLGGIVTRLGYRFTAGRPAPGWLVPIGKVGGAGLLGTLLFWFLPLGGGEGWGWGPGWGMGPADGAGTAAGDGKKKDGDGSGPVTTTVREKLEIELIGGARVKSDGRYYLVKRLEPPQTLAEVEALLKPQADKLEVHLVFTDGSVATSHPAAHRLRDLLRQCEIPTVETQEK
jgi:hypothetical protein